MVEAQRSGDDFTGSEAGEIGVSGGLCFNVHSIAFAAQCKHLVAVAVHAVNGVLSLEETDTVFDVPAAYVPVGEGPSFRGDVDAPPIGSKGGHRVGGKLVKAMSGNDLLGARVDQTHTGSVGATTVVADEHGGCAGAWGVGNGQTPCGLAHEAITGGQGASRLS